MLAITTAQIGGLCLPFEDAPSLRKEKKQLYVLMGYSNGKETYGALEYFSNDLRQATQLQFEVTEIATVYRLHNRP